MKTIFSILPFQKASSFEKDLKRKPVLLPLITTVGSRTIKEPFGSSKAHFGAPYRAGTSLIIRVAINTLMIFLIHFLLTIGLKSVFMPEPFQLETIPVKLECLKIALQLDISGATQLVQQAETIYKFVTS